jgi:type III pantothenate kinase
MNLVIDAGNTLVKVAVFKGNTIVKEDSFKKEKGLKKIKEILETHTKINNCIISTVTELEDNVVKIISKSSKISWLTKATQLPFINKYKSKDTLGADRLALASAASVSHPNKNVLVISAGTCVTYNLVAKENAYLGGAISPGLMMRYKALNYYTAQLPLLSPKEVEDFIGDTTQNSIHSGVVNGICNEIDAVINQYKARFKDLTVILTGGDAKFLSKRLKNTIFASPNFLLEGLNYILEHNKH